MDNTITKITSTMESASKDFEAILSKTELNLYHTAVDKVKSLETNADGTIKMTLANVGKISYIVKSLEKVSRSDEYYQGIKSFLVGFDKLQLAMEAHIEKEFAQFSKANKKRYDAIKTMAVQNTMAGLSGANIDSYVIEPIKRLLTTAVTTNAKYSDLIEQLRDELLSSDDSTSALAKYAGTYATTAMTQYAGQQNKLFTEDLDVEWFRYVGSTIETTREFCALMTQKEYIHKSEIPAILRGEINILGEIHQCKMNPKNNLPYGMVDGTNEDNFIVNVGGWNCRHQMLPIAEESVPQNIRDMIAPASQEDIQDWENFMDNMKNDKVLKQARILGIDTSFLNNKRATTQELWDGYNKVYSAVEDETRRFAKISDNIYSIALKSQNVNRDIFNEAYSLWKDNSIADNVINRLSTNVQYRQLVQMLNDKITNLNDRLDKLMSSAQVVPNELKPSADYWQGRNITLNPKLFKLIKSGNPLTYVITNSNKGAYCMATSVHLEISSRAQRSEWHQESVVYHECGHAIANQRRLPQSQEITDLMNKYKKFYNAKTEYEYEDYEYNYEKNQYETIKKTSQVKKFFQIEKELNNLYGEIRQNNDEWCMNKYNLHKYDALEQIGSVMDTIMTLNSSYGWGHSKSYMKDSDNRAHEFIAHCFENAMIGNYFFKTYLPELYQEMIDFVNSLPYI